jgi:hypothetical protein
MIMKSNILLAFWFVLAVAGHSQERTEPELLLQGQLMTDAGYNFNQVHPDFYDVMRPTQLPAYENQYGTDGNVFFGVRQSMLGMRLFVPTSKGELKARFAFDLFGVGPNVGQTTFHMLYAWVEWGHFGVGYTWSQFCDFDVLPNMVEYWGPVGMSLCKTVMVSYVPFQGANRLSIALERPGATADQGIYRDRIELEDVAPKFALPDLSAEFRVTRDWGYVELAGVLRRIKWVDQGMDEYDLSGEAIGWGLNLSSKLNIGKKDVFKGLIITGQAIQNLMNDAPTDIGIQNNFSDTISPVKGVPLPLVSFSAYLNHYWNTKFSSSLGYSAIFTGNSDGQSDDAFRQGHYASVNLLYYPLENLTAGIELQWIKRYNYNDGWSSSATKIQFSLRYSFSYSLLKNK